MAYIYAMRITSKSRIAVNAMVVVAAHTAHGYAISIPLVGKRLRISRSFLEIIFSHLKSAGLIQSHRGPGGGYSLVEQPALISVKNIIDAIEGPQSIEEGLGAQLWRDLDSCIQNQISRISLADILSTSNVRIELALACLKPKQVEPKIAKQPLQPSGVVKKTGLRLGPNSVFSFGAYLLKN